MPDRASVIIRAAKPIMACNTHVLLVALLVWKDMGFACGTSRADSCTKELTKKTITGNYHGKIIQMSTSTATADGINSLAQTVLLHVHM